MLIMILSSFIDNPLILFAVFLGFIFIFVVLTRQQARIPRSTGTGPPSDYFQRTIGPFRSPELPRLGKWIIIPIAIVGVIGFILFQNWWLNVDILQYLYSSKANLNWWSIQFLDNQYFYACIGVGLLIALSDPRISITRDIEGKRQIHLHSKFLGIVRLLRTQFTSYTMQGSFPLQFNNLTYDDQVSIKYGVAWKLVEFVIGTMIIGPTIAQGLALQFMVISQWLTSQQLSWFDLGQRILSILWTRLFTSELPSGTWLIENSPILEAIAWLNTPISIICILWGVRQGVSLVFGLLRGNVVKAFKSIIIIGLAALTPNVLQIPNQVFDITTPFYIQSMVIGESTLLVLAIFFSLRERLVQRFVNLIYRRKIILTIIVLLTSIGLLYGPIIVAVQYAPAIQGNWKNWIWTPQIQPTIEYTNWATGVEGVTAGNLAAAINTGENIEILEKVRVFNDAAAKLRLKSQIGVNWMDLQNIDVIWMNNTEYWVSALTLVMPTGGDEWRTERLIVTHSERILAIDAHNGEIVPVADVFNITAPTAIYYGEDGLFASSDQIYIDVPGFQENHLTDYTGPEKYDGNPDYVLSGLNLMWYFSGIFGQEQLRLDFARGDYGDIKMLYLRDVNKRLEKILLPDMRVDDDPLLVSDGEHLYYALYVYIDREMPSQYLNYANQLNTKNGIPVQDQRFWRVFSIVLIDAYDGTISGYLLNTNEDNYVLDFYRTVYQEWNTPVPSWLTPQLRYPEFLYDKQIASYNKFHVTNPDVWQGNTNFFDLTTSSSGSAIEDVRYIVFNLNGETYWAAVRLVEKDQSPGKNIAAMYVALNGENLGENFLLLGSGDAVIGPQTVLDTISNFSPTKSLLSLHPNWNSGNILMYGINGTLYYFVPFYAETSTTLAPAMIASVDALTQRVGYYVINNPQNAIEVGLGTANAYADLVGQQVELTAERRRQQILDTFEEMGYTPIKTSEPVANYDETTNLRYLNEADWETTRITLTSYSDTWVAPFNLTNVLYWETTDDNDNRFLHIGVLLKGLAFPDALGLYALQIQYQSG
jgi:hypothetical protein